MRIFGNLWRYVDFLQDFNGKKISRQESKLLQATLKNIM